MGEQFVQQIEPNEVFAALADETRLRILQVLWESDTQMQTFSELRRVIGMTDPGQFNYHLNKLVGQFVTKTDGEYRLTQAGKHVNGAIASGMYTANQSIDPIELDYSCQTSDERLVVRYENETVRIGCEACPTCPSEWVAPVPPAVFAGYDRDEIPDVASRYLRGISKQALNGFCPYCNGRMESSVKPSATTNVGSTEEIEAIDDLDSRLYDYPVVYLACQRCRAESQVALDHALLLIDPAVTNFFYENGIVVRNLSIWEFSDVIPISTDIERRNPIKVNVTFQVDESMCSVLVDETFTRITTGLN